jgi:uncharacterized cofD-like protein
MPSKRNKTSNRIISYILNIFRWLTPGLGIKRWALLLILGTAFIGVGFAVIILDVYRNTPDSWYLPIISFLSLRFFARPVRALIFAVFGLTLIGLGVWGINRTLLKPFMRPGKHIFDTVSNFQKLDKGPKIVVIGGGTGLSALLRGIKKHTSNITAIVTVADDGGSSGMLRRNMGVLPPGDIRNCLTALSNDEELLSQVFQYRFGESAGLNGHSLGNLLITSLAEITGSFEEGIAESGRVLAVQGKVFPSTLHDVTLNAEIISTDINGNHKEIRVKGESEITKLGGTIKRVWLEPNYPMAYPPTIQALLNADLIIIGPGSLYTSLLPNLLVPDITEAFKVSRALKFFISNVATQPGETDGFNCGDHVRSVEKVIGSGNFDIVICNDNCRGKLPKGIDYVCVDDSLENDFAVYSGNLVDVDYPWRHDSVKLANSIMDLYNERTGPLLYKENDLNL